MSHFRQWLRERVLAENDFRTGAKIGLYPDIADALGQYPPLYGAPKASDLQTYIYLHYGPKGVPDKSPGLIDYSKPKHGPDADAPWWVREMRRAGMNPHWPRHADQTKWPWRLPDEPNKKWSWAKEHERLK